jgi:hypothetical protein
MSDIVYIELRDNPGYRYSDVLSAINYNFQLVSGGTGGGSGSTTYVRQGSNITTGGTVVAPIVNVVASPSFNNLTFSGTGQFAITTSTTFSGGTISGGTIYSGTTNLNTVIDRFSTRVQAGSNIATGGTGNAPTVSVIASPSFNNLFLSGSGQFAGVTATSLSATTVSGGTFFSGSTNLSSLFATTGSTYLPTQQVAFGSSSSGVSGSSYFTFTPSATISILTLNSGYGTSISLVAASGYGQLSSSGQLSLVGTPIQMISGNYMRIGGDYNGFRPELRVDGNGLRFCVDGFDTIINQNVNTGITLSHGNLMVGANVAALARVDILSSTTTLAQLRLRSGSTVTSPTHGDIYNESGVTRFNSDLGVNYLSGATGTTRMVEVNSGGTMSASKEIIGAIVDDPTAISLLTTTTNWTVSGVYTGPTITNTYQGQMYHDAAYFYVAMADNYFIRMIRG